jgi:hypothetical protein
MEARRAPEDHEDASALDHLAVASTHPTVEVDHEPPRAFRPGAQLALSLRLRGAAAVDVTGVTLRYRPMNQALPVSARTMERAGDDFVGSVPGEAADGAYPLAYAFVLRDANGHAWRHPGLGNDLAAQPYLIVRPEGNADPGGRTAS